MVFLSGSVNNVEDYLKNANIFTYSAIDGLFGISLLEALAAGLPFVALKGRADGDRLVDGINGFIVDGQDTEQYVAKMLELINNPALATSMGKMNDALAQQHDIVAYTDDLISVYRKISK
jgi:glycosyltransferase involved in cell wall biosynthesis